MNTTLEEPKATEHDAPKMPDMPKPTKEHAWLEKFVGEWETEAEMFCQGGEPMKSTGTESTRMLGGFWIVGHGHSTSPEMPFSNVLTLGYDPKKGKYIGSWIDSMTSMLWKYEGEVNEAGTILSLDTEAECPGMGKPGTPTKFKEVTEFKGPDLRVFTSSMLGEDGEWKRVVNVTFRRKK